MTHFTRRLYRFSPFSSHPENTGNSQVFARLDPSAFQRAFLAWIETIRLKLPSDVVAVDGQTARRTHDPAIDLSPLHIVSAWSTATSSDGERRFTEMVSTTPMPSGSTTARRSPKGTDGVQCVNTGGAINWTANVV